MPKPAKAKSPPAPSASDTSTPAPVNSSENTKSSETKDSFKVSVTKPKPTPSPAPSVEEEDDLSVPVQPGAICKRNGCKAAFVSDEESRNGEGEGVKCTYHPSSVCYKWAIVSQMLTIFLQPIFHEGSKVSRLRGTLATASID